MNLFDVTWKHTLRIWWSLLWKTALISLGLAILFCFIVGTLLALLDKSEHAEFLIGLANYLVAIPVSIGVLKTVLQKEVKKISIAMSHNAGIDHNPVQRSFDLAA